MKSFVIAALACCAMSVSSVVWAAESGALTRSEPLKAEPYNDTKTLKQLSAGEKVSIVGKSGGWYKVKAGRSSGWVRMLSVRKGDAKPASPSKASGLLALASGRNATGKVVASTGVRGLNEEELKAASFNAEEILLAESYAVSRADAQTFATKGKLVARPFAYLPQPK